MLSARRSRPRIPIALVASCLVCATLPGVVCPVVCLTHEDAMPHGHRGSQMTAMAPCHTGDGVKPAQPRGDLTLVALPAAGGLVLPTGPRLPAAPEPGAVPPTVFRELHTPPPRIG